MRSSLDHTLFTKHLENKVSSLPSNLVDDIIEIRDDVVEKERLEKHLAQEFEIKDLKKFKYFYGLRLPTPNRDLCITKKVCVGSK